MQQLDAIGYGHQFDGQEHPQWTQKPIHKDMGEGDDGPHRGSGFNVNKEIPKPGEETSTEHEGERLEKRPSDEGGSMQGHPASGPHTSQSQRGKRNE